ncbi:hypothetical protein ACLOJK_012274 [Asimina triloba]
MHFVEAQEFQHLLRLSLLLCLLLSAEEATPAAGDFFRTDSAFEAVNFAPTAYISMSLIFYKRAPCKPRVEVPAYLRSNFGVMTILIVQNAENIRW